MKVDFDLLLEGTMLLTRVSYVQIKIATNEMQTIHFKSFFCSVGTSIICELKIFAEHSVSSVNNITS